jgi:pyruvate carboxylase
LNPPSQTRSTAEASDDRPDASAPRSPRPIRKLMAANRSEIAVRIFRAGTELNLRTVAIYAQEDRLCIHRYKADEAYEVGHGKGPVAAYLDIESIIGIAKDKGVDAIHPGYGFLSENADLARACEREGIIFVGPRPELLEMMGDKTAARALARRIGVPILPGTDEPITERETALEVADSIGFPLIIKAAFGGGGRGMRVVQRAADLENLLDEAQGEANRAFGNPAVFLEKYIPRAKHLEVQILGDQHGNVIHLHERDCSVQRRHQKVIEVAPSFGLPQEVVNELCGAAARMAREIRYDNAGTVEFIYDLDRHEWFFIEMNPRIQVEHTVTEVITGLDLVRAQILHRRGPCAAFPRGRDAATGGDSAQRLRHPVPDHDGGPGKPVHPGLRTDPGVPVAGRIRRTARWRDGVRRRGHHTVLRLAAGEVYHQRPNYENAMSRARRCLSEFRIRGVKTNIPFLENVIAHPQFRAGKGDDDADRHDARAVPVQAAT